MEQFDLSALTQVLTGDKPAKFEISLDDPTIIKTSIAIAGIIIVGMLAGMLLAKA